MKKPDKKYWIYFMILYLMILFYLTLMPNHDGVSMGGGYNLVPFKGVDGYIQHIINNGFVDSSGHLTFSVVNLLGNLLLLVPFGFLLPLIDTKFSSARKVALCGFLLSSFIELFQFLFLWSRFADVDDIIFNTISALLGYLIYTVIKKYIKKKNLLQNR